MRFSTLLLLLLTLSQFTQAQDSLRTYVFGNSLIHHTFEVTPPTPSQETSIPHWMHFLSQEANKGFALSGQFGFLPSHAQLPPNSVWGFDFVNPAWDVDNETFAEANFDNILMTPANFIQWQGPEVNFPNDSLSPLDYSSQIINWANQQEDSLVWYIYENWPDMAGYLAQGFPPTQTEWADYNAYLQGDFHDWFQTYHDSLMLAHPNHCIRMIPVGPAISKLLAQAPYNQIAIDSLYEDDAPHGRANIYFLAAVTTYMAMYQEKAPASYQAPTIIDSTIRANYPQIVDFLWDELQNFEDNMGNSRVFCQTTTSLENEQPLTFSIYPNPATHNLFIESNLSIQHVSIHNLIGQVVLEDKTTIVPIQQLNSGMYVVKVLLENNQLIQRSLIIH